MGKYVIPDRKKKLFVMLFIAAQPEQKQTISG